MTSTSSFGCLRAGLALLTLLALCFVVGLSLQVGWMHYGATMAAQLRVPTDVPAPPTTIVATATLSPTRTPRVTPTVTTTATRRATATAAPTRPNTPTRTATVPATTTASATPIASPVGADAPVEYVIEEGDTLFSLARTFGVTVEQILALNPDLDPDFIAAGDTILIPSSEE